MSDAPAPGGAIRPDGEPRSLRKGDVPEALARRYYTDERGGRGLGFYVDARIAAPAFRDEGRRLAASRNDPNVARDLARIAHHRGWSMVVEKIVAARVTTPDAHDRILSQARERLARGLEREDHSPSRRAGPTIEPPRRREPIRGA